MSDFHLPPTRPRVPDVELPPVSGGAPVRLRARRQGTVLVLLGEEPFEGESAYLRAVAESAESLRGWDGRVFLVVGQIAVGRPSLEVAPPFPILRDASGTVAAAADVRPPAVVVIDQWGEIHEAASVGEGAPWLPVADLEQWLKYISIRCAG